MHPYKKGQIATEYYLIYTFVIIVVLFSAIVAWQMGIFNPQPAEKASSGILGFSQIVPADFVLYSNNTLQLTLLNNAPDTIEVNQIDASVDSIFCNSSSRIQITSGAMRTFDLECYGHNPVKGSFYMSNVTIIYNNLRTGITGHKSSGEIFGLVE